MRTMPENPDRPQLREHLHEIRKALSGLGRDVAVEAADAPHNVKEGTRNTLAKAAGVRRTPMREWTPPETGARE